MIAVITQTYKHKFKCFVENNLNNVAQWLSDGYTRVHRIPVGVLYENNILDTKIIRFF